MNLLVWLVFLFWVQVVVMVTLAVVTYKVFSNHQLYHTSFFSTPIPLRHVCMFGLALGFLVTEVVFLKTKNIAATFGILHIDALMFSF